MICEKGKNDSKISLPVLLRGREQLFSISIGVKVFFCGEAA
jgi:hypothetical protein